LMIRIFWVLWFIGGIVGHMDLFSQCFSGIRLSLENHEKVKSLV
jgi:hypothetical protein